MKDLFVFKEAALRDEELDILEDGVDHEVPVYYIENLTLSIDDELSTVVPSYHVVQSICSRILDLQVLARNEQAAQRYEEGVILDVMGHLGGVDVHQENCVVDG